MYLQMTCACSAYRSLDLPELYFVPPMLTKAHPHPPGWEMLPLSFPSASATPMTHQDASANRREATQHVPGRRAGNIEPKRLQ